MLSLKLVVNAQKALAVVTTVAVCPQRGRESMQAEEAGHTCPEPQVRGHLCQAQPGPGGRQPRTQSPARLPTPHTDDSQVGAGSDAGDHIGGAALPLPVVLLTQGAELQAPAGQGAVLASAGLPYLGQTRGQGGGREEGQGRREATNTQGSRKDRGGPGPQPAALLPAPPPPRQESPSLLGPRPVGTARSQAVPLPRSPGAPEPRGTFLHVMTGKGSPAAAQGMTSSRPASCLYSQPGSTVKYGGS